MDFENGLQYLLQRRTQLDRQKGVAEAVAQKGTMHPQYSQALVRIQQLQYQERIVSDVFQSVRSNRKDDLEPILEDLRSQVQVPALNRNQLVFQQECTVIRAAVLSILEQAELPQAPLVDVPVQRVDEAPKTLEVEHVQQVILPPDPQGGPIKGFGDQEWFERLGAPRCELLRGLLKDELKVPFREIVGEVPPDSMRDSPYHAFLIPRLKRIIFVNDDYGEATYVVFQCDEGDRDFKKYSRMTKWELRKRPTSEIYRVCYPGDPQKWLDILTDVLLKNELRKSVGTEPVTLKRIQDILLEQGVARIGHHTFIRYLDIIASLTPEYSAGDYKHDSGATSRTGNAIFLYDPKFAEVAIDILVVLTKPNDQWKTTGGVKDHITARLTELGYEGGVDYETVETALEGFLEGSEAQQKGFETRRFLGMGSVKAEEQADNPFNLRTHYSPALVEVVTDKFIKETPPPGWRTITWIIGEIRRRGGVTRRDSLIEEMALRLNSERTEEFQIGYFRESGPHTRHEHNHKIHLNPALTEEVLRQLLSA